jgi:hypothetical protein
MKVVATDLGFDGKKRRRPGEEFEVPDSATASWFRPVEEPLVEEPAIKPRKKVKPPADTADDLA